MKNETQRILLFLLLSSAIASYWLSKTYVFVPRKQRTANVEEDVVPLPVFKSKPLVIWTSDLHVGPIHDLKTFLKPMGVTVIDRNLDYTRCHFTNTCEGMNSLRIVNPHNALHLDYSLISKFYDAYQNDTEMQSVDAFACFHAPSLCELFEPFNKSLIIHSTLRYELGRFGKDRWTKWNQNLIRIASAPWNFVAANNRYDVEYIRYFTGIQPLLLPSFCGYTNQTYNATRKGFLIAQNHDPHFISIFMRNFTDAYKVANFSFEIWPVREKYPWYKYSDMAAHQGIVHVPYQVSVMSFFEQYRMNIPLFAPTRELLSQWVYEFHAMTGRRWNWYSRLHGNKSSIGPHPSQYSVPDPNSMDLHAIRYWLKFSDYYHFPHITYYKSIPDLVDILNDITTEDLQQISERMKLFNIEEEKRLRVQWKNILLTIAERSSNRPH